MTSKAASDFVSAFVSVIVPVFDDPERLRACVERLQRQSYDRGRYEIIVVDNGSSPPVALPASSGQPNLQLLTEEKVGSYAARNRGIRAASGTILAFTDADCLPEPDWIENGVVALESQHAELVSGRVESIPEAEHPQTLVELYSVLFEFSRSAQLAEVRLGRAATANLFTYRSLFDELGLFDDRLKSGGDSEWCHKAHVAGHKLVFCDTATVKHCGRRTWRELYKRTVRLTGGRHTLAVNEARSLLWMLSAAAFQLRVPAVMLLEMRSMKIENLSLKHRAGLLSVFVFIGLTRFVERFRLIFGGQASRG